MLRRRLWLFVACFLFLPFAVRSQGVSTAPIDQALGRPGQKTGDVYKVGFPRTDLHVTVHGLAIKPGLALGSWAAFTGSDDNAMVMGDLVLLEDELAPVMDRLRASGFEITAIHNHLIDETPHVLYMHYMGHGAAAQLATSLQAALATSKPHLEDQRLPVKNRPLPRGCPRFRMAWDVKARSREEYFPTGSREVTGSP